MKKEVEKKLVHTVKMHLTGVFVAGNFEHGQVCLIEIRLLWLNNSHRNSGFTRRC
jgi:hypothetical protein